MLFCTVLLRSHLSVITTHRNLQNQLTLLFKLIVGLEMNHLSSLTQAKQAEGVMLNMSFVKH